MKKLLFPKRRRPKKKLINRQVVKNDPEEYGKNHIKSIQNEEGWYRP
jgi:hypothetical protein